MIPLVAVSSAVCLAIYVLVMPQLSSFLGLGTLLFILMFANCFFLDGMVRFFCSMAILNILQIQNEQVYSFYMMVNMFLFLVMSFAFLFVMSYLLGSPRPEKVVLRLLDRFFGSAQFLVSSVDPEPRRQSLWDLWKIAFHRRQLRSFPSKLTAWSKAIDRRLFAENTPDQIQALITSVQALVYRIEQFLDAASVGQAGPLTRELRDDLMTWHAGIKNTFMRWSRNPEAEPVAGLRKRLEAGLGPLEKRIEEVINRVGSDANREEGEYFFRLLGGYRGISEAALAYARAAGLINWAHLREERFS